jgi:hypothetical protein
MNIGYIQAVTAQRTKHKRGTLLRNGLYNSIHFITTMRIRSKLLGFKTVDSTQPYGTKKVHLRLATPKSLYPPFSLGVMMTHMAA